MAKYQAKPRYDWKTSKTTVEDNSGRILGTIDELKYFEEQLGLVNKVPERKKNVASSARSNISAAAASKADDTKFEPAVDRAPAQETLRTEEVHEVRHLITKEEEEQTMEKVKKHLGTFIGKGSVVKREDALSIAMYAFRLGMIYHQKGSVDKYIEKK